MADKKPKLYNITGTLLSDVDVRKANTQNGEKPYAYAKLQTKGGRVVTVMTFVHEGIKALQGKKADTAVRVYGTYTKGDKGQTFSVMGLSPERQKAAPEVA